MNQILLKEVLIQLHEWFGNYEQKHRGDCRFGTVVQSGPAIGNKYPCTCGLIKLQHSLERVIES